METRAARMRRVADSIQALEAARAKRERRAEAAARDRRAAAAPAPEDRPRRHPRADVKLAAAVIGPEGEPHYGWVFNVSHGGCYVSCGGTFEEGARCTVRLSLPREAGGGRLDLACRVARRDGEGMGLAFEGPAQEASKVLADLVAAYDLTVG
jgi:hypothetical protein